MRRKNVSGEERFAPLRPIDKAQGMLCGKNLFARIRLNTPLHRKLLYRMQIHDPVARGAEPAL